MRATTMRKRLKLRILGPLPKWATTMRKLLKLRILGALPKWATTKILGALQKWATTGGRPTRCGSCANATAHSAGAGHHV